MKKMNPRARPRVPANLPAFCDYGCPHAGFPPPDAVGACRREQAVFCGILGNLTPKNGTCRVRQEKRGRAIHG